MSTFCWQMAKEQSRLFAMMDHVRMKPPEWTNGMSPTRTLRYESPPPPMNLSSSLGKVCFFCIAQFALIDFSTQ